MNPLDDRGLFFIFNVLLLLLLWFVCLFCNRLHTYGTSSGRVVCVQSITA